MVLVADLIDQIVSGRQITVKDRLFHMADSFQKMFEIGVAVDFDYVKRQPELF